MRLEFDFTRDDYAALAFAKSPSASTRRKAALLLASLALLVALLMGVLTVATGSLAWADDPLLQVLLYAIAVVLGLLALVSLLLALLRVWVRRLPRDDGATLGHHVLEVEDDGIRVEGRSGSSLVRWDAILDVRTTDDHVFMYVDRMAALVIPKRAFASADECAGFVERARSDRHRRPTGVPRPDSSW